LREGGGGYGESMPRFLKVEVGPHGAQRLATFLYYVLLPAALFFFGVGLVRLSTDMVEGVFWSVVWFALAAGCVWTLRSFARLRHLLRPPSDLE
jgi:hypothetical protein